VVWRFGRRYFDVFRRRWFGIFGGFVWHSGLAFLESFSSLGLVFWEALFAFGLTFWEALFAFGVGVLGGIFAVH